MNNNNKITTGVVQDLRFIDGKTETQGGKLTCPMIKLAGTEP